MFLFFSPYVLIYLFFIFQVSHLGAHPFENCVFIIGESNHPEMLSIIHVTEQAFNTIQGFRADDKVFSKSSLLPYTAKVKV